MPFACGNEAAADVWREAIRIISLPQIIFTFVWFGFAMLHCAHCMQCTGLYRKWINSAVINGILGNGKGYLKVSQVAFE